MSVGRHNLSRPQGLGLLSHVSAKGSAKNPKAPSISLLPLPLRAGARQPGKPVDYWCYASTTSVDE